MKARKLAAIFLSILLLIATLPLGAFTASAETTSGTTGDCTWTLNGTHLTISGNGAMDDYATYSSSPWSHHVTSVTIEYGVTHIGKYAFYYHPNLTSITIPNSVISIGDYAFDSCYALTSVNIGNSVTHIGHYAFADCQSLSSVHMPNSVTYIGVGAFKSDTSLTSIFIPSRVTYIGSDAFQFCSSLTSVNIPDSVTYIGWDILDFTAFYDDSTNWEDDALYVGKHLISTNNSLSGSYAIKQGTLTIAEEAFEYCYSLTSVTIPNSVITIADDAFSRCSSLSAITIPDSVTHIGAYAFKDTAYFSNTTNWDNYVLYIGKHLVATKTYLSGAYTIKAGTLTIADYAFNRCTGLTSITIPDSVTHINDQAFYQCSSLISVTIPDNVRCINNDTFIYCKSLTSVTIPINVTTIKDGAFYDCDSLTDVYYAGNQADRARIEISEINNNPLLNAKWHYGQGGGTTSTTPSTQPTAPSTPTNPTNPTTPSTPTTPTTPSNPDGYVINVYSEIPSLVIGEDQTIGAAVQVEKDGVVVPSADQFTFAVSDLSKIAVTNIHKDNELQAVSFSINGLSAGTATLTIQEATTGAMYTTTVTITDGILTYNAEALPKMYDGKALCRGIINGIYIDNFVTKEKTDDPNTLLVSFDAYNETFLTGVVEVYDANGTLQEIRIIKRFEGNTVSSYYDTLKQGWYLIKLMDGSGFNYRQPLFSQKTPIENLEVPVGGYVEITNNTMYSDTCMLINASELTVTILLTTGSNLLSLSGLSTKDITEEVTKAMIKNIACSELKKVGKELGKELATSLLEEGGKRVTVASLSAFVNTTLSVVRFDDMDLWKIIMDVAAKAGVGIGESVVTELMGSFGTLMKLMFTGVEYTEIIAWKCRMNIPYSDNALRIYFNDANGCLTANGVSISAEDGSSLAAKNFVMHSVVVTPDSGLNNAMKSALDDLSDKYVVRDIYLEKDGKVTQPGQTVQVSVPIPEDYDPEKCSIYWVQEDGTLTKFDAVVEGNYLLFYTNHFSHYAIVEMPDKLDTIVWVCIILVMVILIFVTVAIAVLLSQKSRKAK